MKKTESFEQHDERLRESAAAAKRERVRARKAAAGPACIWVRLDSGAWGVRGPATLAVGDTVTVTARNGRRTRKVVVAIVAVDAAGAVAEVA